MTRARSPRRFAQVAVACGVIVALSTAAATVDVYEPIDLEEGSRFEVAVAGQVQLPIAVQGPSTSVPRPVGSTIDPNIPTTTQPTTTTAPAVQILINNTNAGARGQAALDRIAYPWEDVLDGWTISFNGPRSDISGWIDFRLRTIYIYVSSADSDTQLGHVIAHEIGHAVDFLLVTPAEKNEWLEARGLGDRNWYPDGTSNDFSSPAGDFAESFAVWQAGGNYQAYLGGNPTAAQIELLERITADR